MNVTIDISHEITVTDLDTGETVKYGIIRGTKSLVPLGQLEQPAVPVAAAEKPPSPEPEIPAPLVPQQRSSLQPGVLGDMSEDAVGALLVED